MRSTWYCTDCEERIDTESIEEHEVEGHYVRGSLRPDRLMSNDPWNVGSDTDGGDS